MFLELEGQGRVHCDCKYLRNDDRYDKYCYYHQLESQIIMGVRWTK